MWGPCELFVDDWTWPDTSMMFSGGVTDVFSLELRRRDPILQTQGKVQIVLPLRLGVKQKRVIIYLIQRSC